MKHQCDYCCWYYSDERGCEALLNMRDKACESARQKKEEAEKRLVPKQIKTSEDNTDTIKREENVRVIKATCSKCKKHYKASVTRDTNQAGMWMEYTLCPDCHQKNLDAWHVW